MQPNDFVEVLTENQKMLLRTFGESQLSSKFYLTGGTALSAFYLYHRFSEDLDFFTSEKQNIEELRNEIASVFNVLQCKIEFIRNLATFIEMHLTFENGETIKMDFAYDSPFRLQNTIKNEKYDIAIDNILDISCNKISAIFDRVEVKDFVDLYFLLATDITFEQLWEQAKKKHIGLDEYWFCQALRRVTSFEQMPKMIKPLTLEKLNKFYFDLHNQIFEKLTNKNI